MPLKGMLVNVETLVAIVAFSVFFYAYMASFVVSGNSVYRGYAALSEKEVAEAQAQAVISSLYGTGANLTAYAAALNSTLGYGHAILPFGSPQDGPGAPGYGTFYRTVPIGGRLYYLAVYTNETSD